MVFHTQAQTLQILLATLCALAMRVSRDEVIAVDNVLDFQR